jgi:hypothetical protein
MFILVGTSFSPSLSNFSSKRNPSTRPSGENNKNTETQREALLDVTYPPAQNHIIILAKNAHMLTSLKDSFCLKIVEFIVSFENTTVLTSAK